MVRQQSRFLNLMEGYAESVDLYKESLNAAGTSNQKFGIWQESTAAKIEKFKATMENLWQNSFDTGVIKDIINLGTRLIETLSKLQEEGKLLTVVIGLISLAFFGVSKKSGEMFLKMIASIITVIPKAITAIKGYIIAFGAAETATYGLSTAMATLQKAFMRFLPALILTGLVYAIQKIIDFRREAKETEETFNNSLKTFGNRQDEIQSLENLSNEYDELNSKIGKTAEEKQKLIEVQNSIGESCKDLGIAYDNEGNAIINNSKQIQEYINLKKQQLELDRSKIVETYDTESKDKLDDLQKKQEKYDLAKIEYEESLRAKDEYTAAGGIKYLDEYERNIGKATDALKEAGVELSKSQENNDALNLSLLNSKSAYMDLSNAIKNNLVVAFREINKVDPNANFNTFLDSFDVTKLDEYSKAVKSFQSDKDITKLSEAYDELYTYLLVASKGNTEFAKTLLEAQSPIEYSEMRLYKFSDALKYVSGQSWDSVNSMISAFSLLGIQIDTEVAGILSRYLDLIDGIQGVADAHSAIVQITNDITEGGKTTGMGGTSSQTRGITAPIMAVGNAREKVKAAQAGGSPNNGIPSPSGSGGGSDKDKYATDQYAQALAKLNAQLEHLQYLKSQLVDTSQEYRDILQQEIDIQKKMQELAHNKAERFRAKISSGSLNQEEIDDAKLSIIDLGDAWRESQEKINDLNFGIVESKVKEFDKNLTILTEDLLLYNSHLELLIPGTVEYNGKLQQITETTKQQIQILKDKQSLIQQELLNDQLTLKNKDELNTKLREINKTQIDYLKQYRDLLVKIAEVQIDKDLTDFKTTSDIKIASIQAQIDAINEENAALDQQKQLEEDLLNIANAEKTLADAKTKLINVQAEKNTRIFQNGTWTYQADPQAIKDAQKQVDDANASLLDKKRAYYDELASIAREAELKALQDQIDAEKDKQIAAEKAAEAKKKLIETSGAEGNKALEDVLINSNITLGIGMKTLLNTTTEYVNQMISELQSLIDKQAEAGLKTGVTSQSVTTTNHLNEYASGGVIDKTEIALVHEGEYMLNKSTVNKLGGVSGVESLISSVSNDLTFSNKINQLLYANKNILDNLIESVFNKKVELENLVSSLKVPTLANTNNVTNNSSTNDKGITISNLNLSNIYDVSGFMRNLKQLAR